ncbi:MAG: hypothetical protein HFJ91_04190 [Muribaculaceae bacterium]|nr:hypothetical protein [Muribaculaceae bacterium]
MLRYLLYIVMVLAASVPAMGAESPDSLARALATFWGSAFKTDDLNPAQKEEFVKGLSEALASGATEPGAYMRGATMGVNIINAFKQMEELGMNASFDVMKSSIVEVVRGGNVGFTVDEAGRYIDAQLDPVAAKEFSAESQSEFITAAAALPGAVTTPSGLVFQVITEGEGEMPRRDSKVVVDYVGRLSDGTVFDSTTEPLTLDVDRLVPGFTEGLMMMRPGGRYRLVIPASLAYGDTGAGGVIPPGAAIDFTVDLHNVTE